MSATGEYVPVEHSDIGLDRSHINAEGQIELIEDSSGTDSGSSDVDETQDSGHGREQKVHLSKRKKLSMKTKKLLHISSKEDDVNVTASAPVLADAEDTVSDARLMNDIPKKEQHKTKDLLHNPVDTVTSKVKGQGGHQVAANLIAKEISHGQEVELVRAQDKVSQARTESEKLLAIKEVNELIKARQDQFVRWTMDRHVTKLRILPQNTILPKRRQDFIRTHVNGTQKMDWNAYIEHLVRYNAEKYGGEYIGYTGDPPAPTKEILVPSVERLLVASAPFQELTMTIRRIYRWDNRAETTKYLVGFLVLWILNMILPGILLGMIYLLLHRRAHGPTIDDLRKDIKRTEDVNETALSISEFIQKKGDEAWVDPIIDELGPWALVQLADVANMMEVIRNFYEWRVPSRTGITLGILVVGFFAVTLTPVWLLVRVITLSAGLAFFGLFPISSRFPEYRLLASPMKWMLWKIPTHAEWSIKALQAEGTRHRDSTRSSSNSNKVDVEVDDQRPRKPDPLGYRGPPTTADGKPVIIAEPKPEHPQPLKEYGTYLSKHLKHPGRLVITSTGIRYESTMGHSGEWSLDYRNINRMEKITHRIKRNITKESGEDLKFTDPDGKEYILLDMEHRDQAFSQVVGYSPVTWQVVW